MTAWQGQQWARGHSCACRACRDGSREGGRASNTEALMLLQQHRWRQWISLGPTAELAAVAGASCCCCCCCCCCLPLLSGSEKTAARLQARQEGGGWEEGFSDKGLSGRWSTQQHHHCLVPVHAADHTSRRVAVATLVRTPCVAVRSLPAPSRPLPSVFHPHAPAHLPRTPWPQTSMV